MSLRTRFFLRIRGMMFANNRPTQPPALVLDFLAQTYEVNVP